VFALRSEAPINFEFQLAFVQPHAAFTVDPLAGKHMLYHLSHLMEQLLVVAGRTSEGNC